MRGCQRVHLFSKKWPHLVIPFYGRWGSSIFKKVHCFHAFRYVLHVWLWILCLYCEAEREEIVQTLKLSFVSFTLQRIHGIHWLRWLRGCHSHTKTRVSCVSDSNHISGDKRNTFESIHAVCPGQKDLHHRPSGPLSVALSWERVLTMR